MTVIDMASFLKRSIRSGLNSLGYEVRLRGVSQNTACLGDCRKSFTEPSYQELVDWSTTKFIDQCSRQGISTVLDIGANSGQFGKDLRRLGYEGRIISFEPLSAAHAQLEAVAYADPNWIVASRVAVGEHPGEASINVAGNSYSSSLLPMLAKHVEGAPESVYIRQEHCSVICLDDYVSSHLSKDDPLALKIDTQGYEHYVLRGATKTRRRISVVLLELSLTPLYAGAASLGSLYEFLGAWGLKCVDLLPEFRDRHTGELLQMNGLFARL